MICEFKYHSKPIAVFFIVLGVAGLILFCVSWAFFSSSLFWILVNFGWVLFIVGIMGIGCFRRRYNLHGHTQVINSSEESPLQDPYYPAPAGYAAAPAGYHAAPAGYPTTPSGYAETPGDTTNPVDYPGGNIDP